MTRASEPAWAARSELRLLNHDLRRVDGPLKVTGRARYTHDVRLPGMVYARLFVHPSPRAEVRRVDVEAARAVPGVVHVEATKAAGEEIRYQGEDGVLAVVVAETPDAADDGLRAIVVEVTERDPVVTRERALERGAPAVGRGGANTGAETSEGEREAALAALEGCDAVVEATYTLPVQHHVCLETHGFVVDYRGGETATVYASTQAVSTLAGACAEALGLPAGAVRVVTEHMGGGFGAKFSPGVEGLTACRLARALRRPVHLMLTRPQEFLMAGNRSGSHQAMRAGASSDGRLVALTVEADRLGGVGQGSLPTPPYIYSVEHAFARVRSVYTATDANRAMRAPGHPQASFAMESVVDELAYAIGMDPLEFRKRNLEDPVWHRQLDRVAAEIGWAEHAHRTAPGPLDGTVREGIGFAVTIWSSGARPGSRCEVRVHPDGTVVAATGTQDLGTGTRTYVAAIVAEELGLELADVAARIGDSDLPWSAPSGGSVTVGSLAPAVKDAAHQTREALARRVAEVLRCEPDDLVWAGRRVAVRGDGERSLTWEQACATLGSEGLSVTGEWRDHLRGRGIHGAQAARVRVDPLTGELRVLKMVAIHDQGLVLNRLALRSQINGGVIQALSYGLFEERVHDPDLGLLLNANLEDYKIAGTLEIPEIVALPDDDDERGVVMGMAEAPVICGHAAIANALYNACGVRVRDLPLSPDRILTAIAALG